MRWIAIVILFAAAFAQSTDILWQPPKLGLPDSLPKANIPNEVVTKLKLGTLDIVLEKTSLVDVAKKIGGTIGSRGDAGEALHWLCLIGSDSGGRWALWLESDEMGGGNVDGVAWQRISKDATADRRCWTGNVQIELPIRLALNSTESDVRMVLGQPTAKYRDTLIFDHEHQEMIRNEPFTVSNSVYVELRRGLVWSVQIWRTTSN